MYQKCIILNCELHSKRKKMAKPIVHVPLQCNGFFGHNFQCLFLSASIVCSITITIPDATFICFTRTQNKIKSIHILITLISLTLFSGICDCHSQFPICYSKVLYFSSSVLFHFSSVVFIYGILYVCIVLKQNYLILKSHAFSILPIHN